MIQNDLNDQIDQKWPSDKRIIRIRQNIQNDVIRIQHFSMYFSDDLIVGVYNL